MPIDKVSQAQFAAQIAAGINDRADDLDTAYGPIPDACIQPQAAVLESQNDRVRQLSLLLTLSDPSAFDGFDSDLEGIAFNEGATRILGSKSSTTATFARAAAPTADALVQRGFPVGSSEDPSTGGTITFVTSEAATLPVASASSYFNIQTQKYELSVPLTSIIEGSSTRVGPNRLTRPLRPLGAFDSVTNPGSASGGRDQETNSELIDRYMLGVIGRQPGTPNGIDRYARANFPDVLGLKSVYGSNVLLVRAATDAGAVDTWIKGSSPVQLVENHVYLGVGQTIAVSSPPLVSVVSVQSGVSTYIEGSDYEVVEDTSGVGRSVREEAGIRFLTGGPTALPAVGDTVTVTYTYDNLIRSLQAGFEDDEVLELGRDLLFRRGEIASIIHTARLRVAAGFNATTVQAAVVAAVLAFVNDLNLGADVEGSDIQGVVRAISGVDNYIIDRLTRSTTLAGVTDVLVDDNEYAELTSANLTVSLI
ncbi:hypothetical protein Rctr197k_078 [Virus Rctr197k]|nr:hypothetical protein Rctr197k_078 [Virus Rctr197k]